MKKLLSALVALSLTSCTTAFPAVPGLGSLSDPSVTIGPVANKAVPALITAWRGYDAVVTAVQALRVAGVIQQGSPKALRIADALERALNALNAATDAVRAGNETSFTGAMALARQAFTDAQSAIGGS
jgi:hypothetical protein